MKPNPGIEALWELVHMGYRFTVNGETIKAKYDMALQESARPLWI